MDAGTSREQAGYGAQVWIDNPHNPSMTAL